MALLVVNGSGRFVGGCGDEMARRALKFVP